MNLNDLFLVKSREEENTNPIWEFRQHIFTGIQFGDELEFGLSVSSEVKKKAEERKAVKEIPISGVRETNFLPE